MTIQIPVSTWLSSFRGKNGVVCALAEQPVGSYVCDEESDKDVRPQYLLIFKKGGKKGLHLAFAFSSGRKRYEAKVGGCGRRSCAPRCFMHLRHHCITTAV